MKPLSFFLYRSRANPRGDTRQSDHASRGERAVRTASFWLAASDADAFTIDVGRDRASCVKIPIEETQLGLKRALQGQSPAVTFAAVHGPVSGPPSQNPA